MSDNADDLEAEQMLADALKDDDGGKPEIDWKGHAREWERRAKENAAAAKRLKELEDAQKTEAEKTAERLAGAERRATDAEMAVLRLEVALDKAPEGMPIAQIRKLARRLSGTTREELEADAAELFGVIAPSKAAPRRPVESLRPGALPAGEPASADMNTLMRRMASRT